MKILEHYKFFLFIALLSFSHVSLAHHVLGRPAYSLSEDSNTPPSMQAEVLAGPFLINYMAFPAFPKVNEPGRVNLYISRMDNGPLFDGEVSFSVHTNSWLKGLFGSQHQASLGTQNIDDGIYRQGFVFTEDGNYIIRANFFFEGEPFVVDFPLTIGETNYRTIWVSVLALFSLLVVLINLKLHKKLPSFKIRQVNQREDT